MTLMEALEALKEDIEQNTDYYASGEHLRTQFRATNEDFADFQHALINTIPIAAAVLGPKLALESMIQTALTVGYEMRVAHEEDDANARVGQDKPA